MNKVEIAILEHGIMECCSFDVDDSEGIIEFCRQYGYEMNGRNIAAWASGAETYCAYRNDSNTVCAEVYDE